MDEEIRLLKEECDNYCKYDNIYFFLSELISEKGKESVSFCIKKRNIKNIIIYGAGSVARVLYDYIDKYKLCNILGVVDKCENEEFGFHEFIALDNIENYKYDLIIITPLSPYKNILSSLKKIGVEENKLIFIGEMIDYKRRWDIYENGLHL